MKALLLSTTFLVIGSAAATAAPVFDWTGCYVGAQVGAAAVRTFTATDYEGFGNAGDGMIAGGQAGCNYQQGNWVVGVEGEGAWSNARVTNALDLRGGDRVSLTAKHTSNFSIAARAGIVFDRTLIYGKGGWAVGLFDFNSRLNDCCVGLPDFRSASDTASGFLVGGGMEHALTRHWTVKLEYNYSGFGSKNLNVGVDPGSGDPVVLRNSLKTHIAKVGVNYLFDVGRASAGARP